jgi:hypothetical protein
MTICRVCSRSWSSTLPKMARPAVRRPSQPTTTTELRVSAMPRAMPLAKL